MRDDAKFCLKCGAPMNHDTQNKNMTARHGQGMTGSTVLGKMKGIFNGNHKTIGIVIAAVLVILIVVNMVNLVLDSTIRPKKTVGKFMAAMEEASDSGDPDALIKVFGYTKVVDEMSSKEKKDFEYYFERLAKDDIKKLTYSIENKKKLSKSKIEKLNDNLETIEDEYDVSLKKITKAVRYEVKIKYRQDGESKRETAEITVGKRGGKWYVVSVEEVYDSESDDDE